VSGSWDGTVRLWETTSGELNKTLRGHEGKVTSVAFSDSGEWLVSGGMDETVRIWAVVSGDVIDVLQSGVVHPITSVTLSRGGAYLAEASNDFTVRLWDLKKEGTPVQEALSWIRDDAKRLSAAEFDNRESQRSRRASRSLRNSLRRSFFGQDDAQAASAPAQPQRIKPVVGRQEPMLTLKGHTATVTDVAFHPIKEMLLTVSHDATARMYNTSSGDCLGKFRSDCGKSIWTCRFSADGSILALGTGEGVVEVWSAKTAPDSISLLFSFHAHAGFVDSLAFSGDGLRLATGSGVDVVLWKLKPADWYLIREQQRQLMPLNRTPLAPPPVDEAETIAAADNPSPAADAVRLTFPAVAGHVGDSDVFQLLEVRKAALADEEQVVKALHVAVQKRQEDIDALGEHAARLTSRGNRRADMHLPAWGLATEDADYLEKLRARKRLLYQRVGRAEPKGDTATVLDIPKLHPHDLERLARFEELRQLGDTPVRGIAH